MYAVCMMCVSSMSMVVHNGFSFQQFVFDVRGRCARVFNVRVCDYRCITIIIIIIAIIFSEKQHFEILVQRGELLLLLILQCDGKCQLCKRKKISKYVFAEEHNNGANSIFTYSWFEEIIS